jgi:acylphosphatase
MSNQVARRYIVKGRVQGVGYRYFAKTAAEKRGLTGYARNSDDGSVEVLAIGDPAQVEDFLADLQRGPGLAQVSSVHHEPAPLEPHRAFEIW